MYVRLAQYMNIYLTGVYLSQVVGMWWAKFEVADHQQDDWLVYLKESIAINHNRLWSAKEVTVKMALSMLLSESEDQLVLAGTVDL